MDDLAELSALGDLLRARGLTERSVRLLFGVASVGHAPLRAVVLRPPDLTPAALLPWLFAGGGAVPRVALEARIGRDRVRELAARELCELVEPGGAVRPRRLVLPVGEGFAVADLCARGPVQPDDSSFHLIGTLPERRVERWLDVGTGSAIAPLARRGLARRVVAADIDRSALALARLGAGLSGAGEIEVRRADLLEAAGGERFDLVTFNAPLPRDGGLELSARFFAGAGAVLAPDGEALVHAAIPDPAAAPFPRGHELPGELLVALYTPPGASVHFGVTRWRPGAAPGRRVLRVELTEERPHLRRADLDQ